MATWHQLKGGIAPLPAGYVLVRDKPGDLRTSITFGENQEAAKLWHKNHKQADPNYLYLYYNGKLIG